MKVAYPPSSFWSLERALAEEGPTEGTTGLATLLRPPPPRRGFAMRPKLREDDAAAFCANIKFVRTTEIRSDQEKLTAGLVQPLLDGLKLSLEFLVLC